MPRLTIDEWTTIQAEYEAGASQADLSRRHGVTRKAIQNHIAQGNWVQDAEPAIRRKVAEKVAGVVAISDPVKRAAAIDAEAERRAEVVKRHREEIQAVRSLLYAGMNATRDATKNPGEKEGKDKAAERKAAKSDAFDDLKAAKISSETLLNIHRAERQAWGLDAKEDPAVQIVANLFQGRIDLKSLTIEQLREMRGQLE